ncbi:unnamed protein product [Ectocarpus sp. 12 AP-2014]
MGERGTHVPANNCKTWLFRRTRRRGEGFLEVSIHLLLVGCVCWSRWIMRRSCLFSVGCRSFQESIFRVEPRLGGMVWDGWTKKRSGTRTRETEQLSAKSSCIAVISARARF